MRVVCSCVALAVCVALLNASWAGQDKGKQDKKQKVLDVGKGLDLKGTLDNELGIEYNAPKAKKGSKVKKAYQAFDVKFVKGKTYQIDMIVDEGVVAYLFLEDSKKNVVDENLSGGDDPICARITFKAPEDGVYRIIATTFMGFGQGDFQLKVAEKAGQDKEKPKQDKQPKVLDVGKGLEINSKLNKDADGPYAAPDAVDGDKNKKQHKLFLVNFVKGKTYQIDMIRGENAKMDPYLFLEDAKKKVLAEDDDSGGENDAQIEFKAPESGVYRIICTTFGPVGFGDFTLKVTEKK